MEVLSARFIEEESYLSKCTLSSVVDIPQQLQYKPESVGLSCHIATCHQFDSLLMYALPRQDFYSWKQKK